MRKSPFKKGDFFCSVSPGFIGNSIQFVQKARTIGLPSSFTHAGLFLDGDTVFESLWKVQRSNVWDHYEGKQFLVGRWRGMTDEKFDRAWETLKTYEGKWYPVPRLLMFLFTPILVQLIAPSKWLGLGYFFDEVCSEMAVDGLWLSSWEQMKEFRGRMPAHVAQIIREWRDVEIVHPKALLRRDSVCSFE
ncbi:hypothetical protein LCGC14_2231550 [marine sediment metagenome]|uniref:Uncharacterized protein n=1 Tax=marine sediment metagenome TaxID=412755 RepID=A0A0F9DVU3_9ZZZZ